MDLMLRVEKAKTKRQYVVLGVSNWMKSGASHWVEKAEGTQDYFRQVLFEMPGKYLHGYIEISLKTSTVGNIGN